MAREAVNAGNKLLNIDKVTAIIGGVCSSETLAVAPLAEKAKVPLVSAASTNPKITTAGEYTFRFVPSDSFQGTFTADHFVNTLKKKKVAVMYCKSDYCVGIKDAFTKKFKELGGEVVAEEGFERDARDLRSQITKVESCTAGTRVFCQLYGRHDRGTQTDERAGRDCAGIWRRRVDDPKIGKELKDKAHKAQYSLPANQSLPQEFVEAMEKRTGGKELVVYAPRAYDILKSLTEIMGQKGVGPENIKAGLSDLKDWKGIADTYSLDENGDVLSAKYVIKEFNKEGKAKR